MAEKNILIDLRGHDRKSAFAIANKVKDLVAGFKIGSQVIAHGNSIIDDLRALGEVFADNKLNDTPDTIEQLIRAYGTSITYFSIMTMNQMASLERAVAVKPKGCYALGVSAFTSMDDADTNRSFGGSVGATIFGDALKAKDARLDGLVCSADTVEPLVRMCHDMFMVAVGLRSKDTPNHDQKRAGDPVVAALAGARRLVIGREATESNDPRGAVQRTYESIDREHVTLTI